MVSSDLRRKQQIRLLKDNNSVLILILILVLLILLLIFQQFLCQSKIVTRLIIFRIIPQ